MTIYRKFSKENSKCLNVKSKFVVPVRKESSAINHVERSLKISNDISMTKIQSKKKNEIEEKNEQVTQNLSNGISNEKVQKTKTSAKNSEIIKNSKKTNNSFTDKVDDEKKSTKISDIKTKKKDKESNINLNTETVVVKEAVKADRKGKRKMTVVEEVKYGLGDDDNDSNSYVGNVGADYENDGNNDKDYDDNNDFTNFDTNLTTVAKAGTRKSSNKIKDKNKNENESKHKNDSKKKYENKDSKNKSKGREGDGLDVAHTLHSLTATKDFNKTEKADASEVKAGSLTIKAVKNIPRNTLPTSLHRSAEGSLEEEILSDDDSLSLGSEHENYDMEEEEKEKEGTEEMEKKEKGKKEVEEGKGKRKKGVEEEKGMERVEGKMSDRIGKKSNEINDKARHLTTNDSHHDMNHNDDASNNNKNDEEEEVDDDDDDMFFGE